MIIGKGATLSIKSEGGEFVEVGGIIDFNIPLSSNEKHSYSSVIDKQGEITGVFICDDASTRVSLEVVLQELGLLAVDSVAAMNKFNHAISYQPPHEIRIPDNFCNGIISDHSKGREHGWYNKFNKHHGKRNLKR